MPRTKTETPALRLRFFDTATGKQIFEKSTSNSAFLSLNEGDTVELYGDSYNVITSRDVFDLVTETVSTNVYLDGPR